MSRARRLRLEALETRQLLTGSLIIGALEGSSEEGTNVGPPEGYVEFSFPVTYSGDVCPGGFDVDWSVSYPTDEPKAEAADFKTGYTSGTIHFEGLDDPGGETQYAVVRVVADAVVELNEQFYVDISNVSVGGITISTSRATGTITNDDESIITTHISQQPVSSVSASEGNSGTNTNYVIYFHLSNTIDTAVSFDYDFFDWHATQGTDYTVSSDHGTFNNFAQSGYQTNTLTVTFTGDNVVELNEDFQLTLNNLQTAGRNVKFDSGTGTTDVLPFEIQNDDTASVFIVVRQGYSPKDEGSSGGTTPFIFDVTVNKAVDVPFTINVNTNAGTASAPSDYQLNSATLQFAGTAGESHPYTVQVVADTAVEPDETFDAVLGAIQASGRDVIVSPSTGSATATILNDD